MEKKIEMINSYLIDGEDFIFNDNHGTLTRCKDCKHRQRAGYIRGWCTMHGKTFKDDFYCAYGKGKDDSE